MKIVYKGDPEKIKEFLKQGINGPFELYIRNSKDFEVTLPNLISVHFPTRFDDGRKINLSESGRLGDESERMLSLAVKCAKRNNTPLVVFHPPEINLLKETKQEAIRIMAERIKRVADPSVKICLENVCLWINRSYRSQPLFTRLEEFMPIKNILKDKVGLVFDIEHMCITSIMDLFHKKFSSYFKKAIEDKNFNEDTLEERFEQELKQFLAENDISEYVHNYLAKALLILKPNIGLIHTSGSDFNNYFFNPKTKLPLIGEHLAIGFDGVSHGVKVRDRINHKVWIEIIKDIDIGIVMEISPIQGYDLIDLIKQSEAIIKERL